MTEMLGATSEPHSRQTRRYEERREAILATAARLINQRGIKGTTLSDVARGVGLAMNSVSYYFRRKEDLAAACFLRTIETITGLAARADEVASGTPEARICALFSSYFRLLAETASGQRAELVSFHDVRTLVHPHADIVFGAYTDMFRRTRALLRGDARQPPAERRDLNARAHLLISLLHGSRTMMTRYEPEDYARVADRIGDILVHGLAQPRSLWTLRPLPELDRPAADGADVSPEAFLRAATYLVNEHGYRGASVDKISARLRVTKGAFYHHITNKDGLVADCFARTFSIVRRMQDAARDGGGTGWDQLCAASNALVAFQLSDRGPLIRVTALSALPEALRHRTILSMDRLAERFASFIVDGIADGSIRPVDPYVAAQLVSIMINAAAELRRWVPAATAETAPVLFAKPLFAGLLSPQPASAAGLSPPM